MGAEEAGRKMNEPRITLLESQHKALTDYLDADENGHERAAIVLFRRIADTVGGLNPSDRYLCVDVIPFEDEWVSSASAIHIDFKLEPFCELYRRCEEEELVFGFVHNHPTGYEEFSDTDDENEKRLLRAISNRNGTDISFVSLLWSKSNWFGRVRYADNPDNVVNVRHVSVIGDRLQLFGCKSVDTGDDDILARQEAAFGKPFVDKLQSLRIGVIGSGGTGSAILTLISRSGVGEIVNIDDDKLERSNLNRVRGSRKRDVGEYKTKILKQFIDEIELPVRVAEYNCKIDESPAAIDALASCDLIFGCTDDQIGREALTLMIYLYACPAIDIGLGGMVVKDKRDGTPTLGYHYGRVSTIFPEHGECLFCQGVIKDEWIQAQYALRENPDLTKEEMKERYLVGGGEDAPGVIPFTSGTADLAVATLYDLIKPYRKYADEMRRDIVHFDFVRMSLESPGTVGDPDCPYCKQGRYTLVKEKCRLNRPVLGKRDSHV